jgi:hypothetical protein
VPLSRTTPGWRAVAARTSRTRPLPGGRNAAAGTLRRYAAADSDEHAHESKHSDGGVWEMKIILIVLFAVVIAAFIIAAWLSERNWPYR